MDERKNIPDMLITGMHLPYEKPLKWGFQWFGFCYGRRFHVVADPNLEKMSFDIKQGKYYIKNKEQEKLLPEEIRRLMKRPSLSNEYLLTGKLRIVSVEVIFSLIEEGFFVDDIKMETNSAFIHNDDRFFCRYKEKTLISY